jgi:hypothetical protein
MELACYLVLLQQFSRYYNAQMKENKMDSSFSIDMGDDASIESSG